MDHLTQQELAELLETHDGPHVSIYMPTHRAGPDRQQNPIRLKNLLSQAEERLIEGGLRSPDARALLAPAQALLDDALFWTQQGDGLAAFLDSQRASYYRLPQSFDELLVVADRFHIKPLLPLFEENETFYILALSQDSVRLFESDRFNLRELEVQDMPRSMAEALPVRPVRGAAPIHTRTAPRAGGKRRAMYFGSADPNDDVKTEIRRYFKQVADAVDDFLQERRAPLVLAGVEYLHPIYKEVTGYRAVMEQGIKGNPEEYSLKELHNRAWELVEPITTEPKKQALGVYKHLQGTGSGRALDDLTAVIPAARHGRVDALFVPVGREQWGTYDAANDRVELHDEPQPGDVDLLDFAVVQSLLNGSRVFALDASEMPANKLIAAILRY